MSKLREANGINEVAANRAHQDVIRRVQRVTYAGMAINIVVASLKGVGGVLYASQALLADAIHSLSDLVTDLAVIFGVKYWEVPADEEHPYGHGKIQALVTLFIAVALCIVAWELGESAIRTLLRHTWAPPGIMAFFMALISVVAKEGLYRWNHHVALQVKSPALDANAWHHRSDAISSVPVAIAVIVAYLFPTLAWLDAAGALLVAFFILHISWAIAKPALQELIDAGIDEKSEAVVAIARNVAGVQDIHRVRVRRCGGAFLADLHVQVSAAISVAAGHTIGHDVKNALIHAHLDITDVVVHIEPADVRAIVALGSNIEPRAEYLKKALKALSELPCTHLVKASKILETEPQGVPSIFAHQKFLNQVAVFETALEVHDFSNRMHAIENDLGRVRQVPNGPRTIDLDLIDFNQTVLTEPTLTLPHPRAHERDFVMNPLAELGITLNFPQTPNHK